MGRSLRERPARQEDAEPFVDVDSARKRSRTVERLADAPDIGPLTDPPEEPFDEDPNDVAPGRKADIFERGTIIEPSG